MWGARRGDRGPFTCPACGSERRRSETREYDRYGNRWDRDDKTFEYLCRACHGALCHQPREGLETLLCEINAGGCSDSEFLQRYLQAVDDRSDPIEER